MLFDVCRKLGDDIGIDPLWVRLGFITLFCFSPFVSFGIYIALSIIL